MSHQASSTVGKAMKACVVVVARPLALHDGWEAETKALITCTQRAQYPLTKGFTLNKRGLNIMN